MSSLAPGGLRRAGYFAICADRSASSRSTCPICRGCRSNGSAIAPLAEAGLLADIILVRMDDLNMAPFTDGVRMIVLAAQPANVDTVLVDGRVLKRGGRLQHIDTAKIMADASETMGRVRAGVEKVLERSGVSVVR